MFLPTNYEPWFGKEFSKSARNSASSHAGWALATLCASKGSSYPLRTKISDTINVGSWSNRSARMDKPEVLGRAALERRKLEGLSRTLVGWK